MVEGMQDYWTYHLPKSSWSEYFAMPLCLAETLLKDGFCEDALMHRFIAWKNEHYITTYGMGEVNQGQEKVRSFQP